ncbi:hypothetical protein [Janthinobacterium sp. LB2P70]|uniref:hypothetical protein n=1 Tax=Janthinobacterium sp. LB2P70 TaxID=3424197 RepID=UPI003F1E84B5
MAGVSRTCTRSASVRGSWRVVVRLHVLTGFQQVHADLGGAVGHPRQHCDIAQGQAALVVQRLGVIGLAALLCAMPDSRCAVAAPYRAAPAKCIEISFSSSAKVRALICAPIGSALNADSAATN